MTALDIVEPTKLVDGVVYRYLDAGQLENCLEVFRGADVVFNLAAKVAGVQYNQSHNLKMLYDNLPLQVTPVLAAEQLTIPYFLQVSSVCVYADEETAPCNDNLEVTTMKPPNWANYGYAMSKRMGEIAVEQAKLNTWVVARPTNIYGPGDDFGPNGHVIPALIKKSIQLDEPVVNGTGQEEREFIYVGDVAKAFIHLIEQGDNGTYNIGTNGRTKTSIKNLMGMVQDVTNTQNKAVLYRPRFQSGDAVRYTDSTKLESTGFRAKTTLREGLSKTVSWWRGL